MVCYRSGLTSCFQTRYFYNSNFVHKNFLDEQYICRLKSVCRRSNDNVSYSDVVKRKMLQSVERSTSQQLECRGQVTKNTVSRATPQRGKIAKGKTTVQYGHSSCSKTGLYFNTKKVTDQYVSYDSSVQPNTHVCQVTDNRCVHENRFASSMDKVDTGLYDHNVELKTVNRCPNNTRVNDTNGRKVVVKGRNTFTDCVSIRNPVHRGHNSYKSLGIKNLNPVIHVVDENSTDSSS